MNGSTHNDPFVRKGERLGTATNNSGGVQGGISNGEPIFFRVAFKPPATIGKAQTTVDFKGKQVTLEAKGRHDPCVVPRAVPIVETMAALVIADLALQQRSRGSAE
jgi:chorismate synthase